MVLTTDKDPRFLVCELALAKIRKHIHCKSRVKIYVSRKETNEIISSMAGELMGLKYCYMAPSELRKSEMLANLLAKAKELYLHYQKRIAEGMGGMGKASLLWAFGVFSGLPQRLKNHGERPFHGIDIIAVIVRNISPLGNYYFTRCLAGPRNLSIVTNLTGIKPGITLGGALLPPALVGGEISEAMFLGQDPVDAEAGAFLFPPEESLGEVDGMLFNELKQMS